MKSKLRWFLLAAGVAASCLPAKAQEKAEVLHWWATGGQAAAIKVFADSFNAQGGEWRDNAINGGDNAIPAGINRILGGNPPTAFQFYTALIPELAEQGLLSNLDDVAEEENWNEVLPPYVMDLISYDGHVYGVPANRVTYNWVWYNKKIFADLGIEEPKTWDDFFAAGETMREAGIIPMAFGDQPWQIRTLFHTVLAGVGGKEVYQKIFVDRDVDAVETEDFRKAAEAFIRMRDLMDPGITNRMFNESAAMIVRGEAGMTIMGDWQKGEFTAAGWTAGEEYGCILGLGNGVFAVDSSIFVMPKLGDAEATDAQKLLAKVVVDQDNQLDFNRLKGSLPVRTDVDSSKIDACAAIGADVLAANPDRQVIAPDSVPSDLSKSLTDIEVDFFANPDMPVETFQEKFASVLALFPKD